MGEVFLGEVKNTPISNMLTLSEFCFKWTLIALTWAKYKSINFGDLLQRSNVVLQMAHRLLNAKGLPTAD